MKDVNDLMQAILEMDAAQRRESEKARLERSARLAALDEQKQKIIAECDAREKAACEAAAKAAGEKNVELIHVKDITAVSGYVRGGCSPIGMKKQYPTVIQECAAQFDKVYVSGGRIGTTLCMAPEDLKKVSRAEYADFIQ